MAVIFDILEDTGDPVALLVALVAELSRRDRLPENEVAVLLKELIEAHPEAREILRMWKVDEAEMKNIFGRPGSFISSDLDTGRVVIVDSGFAVRAQEYVTEAEAEAVLFAEQPEPRAIVRIYPSTPKEAQ